MALKKCANDTHDTRKVITGIGKWKINKSMFQFRDLNRLKHFLKINAWFLFLRADSSVDVIDAYAFLEGRYILMHDLCAINTM